MTKPVKVRSAPGLVWRKRRLDREADALAVVKAMTRSPSAPAEIVLGPLSPTHIPGDPEAAGVVYFVYCAGRIKIGYTAEIRNRMASMASNCPAPITLLLTIRGGLHDEAYYHEMFAADRVHLEWFRLSYELRDFLDSQIGADSRALLFEAECDHLDAVRETVAHVSELLELR